MEQEQECRECTLPVREYKQFTQQEEDLCEFCFIAVMSGSDQDSD